MLVAYVRVSTEEQSQALQIDALTAAGCEKFFMEKASGADRGRPQLAKMLAYCKAGDTIVIWRLDRLARSVLHLCEIVELLNSRNIGLKSLKEDLNTTTSGGRLILHIFAALAEFERSLIRERVQAGVKAAKERGVRFGRPTKVTPELLAQAKEIIASTHKTVRETATELGVGKSSLYRAL